MSVMNRLKELSSEGGQGEFQRPEFASGNSEQMGEMEQMMQAQPIPGQSLTQDPSSPAPFETPPEHTDIQEFIEDAFMELSDPDRLPKLLGTMRSGIPVEDIAQRFLMGAFQKGKINPDMLMQSIEPTIYMLISLATYAEVDPVLYPEDDMVDEEIENQTDMFKRAGANLRVGGEEAEAGEEGVEDVGPVTIDNIAAPSVMPRSLLARAEQAVGSVEQGEDNEL